MLRATEPLTRRSHARPWRASAALWALAAACLVDSALAAGTESPKPLSPYSASPAAESAPTWGSLSASQRAALQPLQREWRVIGPDQKQKWLEVVAQFPVKSADERQRIQARMTEWAALTPEQRGTARLKFKQAQQLAPSNRQARWEAYQALPEAEKKELAARAVPPSSGSVIKHRMPVAGSGSSDSTPVQTKSNEVVLPDTSRQVRAVAPTLVQAPTGATTTLISKRPSPPAHQQTGLPKITATPNFVNPSTLLPKRGPQGAAVVAASASAPPAARP